MLNPNPPSPFSSSIFWISSSHIAKGDAIASSVTLSSVAAAAAFTSESSATGTLLRSICFCRGKAHNLYVAAFVPHFNSQPIGCSPLVVFVAQVSGRR